jgi:hypothetical protein
MVAPLSLVLRFALPSRATPSLGGIGNLAILNVTFKLTHYPMDGCPSVAGQA